MQNPQLRTTDALKNRPTRIAKNEVKHVEVFGPEDISVTAIAVRVAVHNASSSS
jgi:hypothetical protein